MCADADGIPHVVERLKVMVDRGVIAGLTPDALLSVAAVFAMLRRISQRWQLIRITVLATEPHYLAPILGTGS